jgi:hypothetical protein
MLTGVRRAFVAVVLAACLGIGCKPFANTSEPGKTSYRRPTSEVPVAPGQYEKKVMPRDGKLKPLQVFAEKSFYLERPEPEEILIGVLQLAHVREGPNTRDMPFRLVVGADKLKVYVAGLDVETLRPYVGHEVEVVGKRIDQRIEGYGIEIWIATIENSVSESK